MVISQPAWICFSATTQRLRAVLAAVRLVRPRPALASGGTAEPGRTETSTPVEDEEAIQPPVAPLSAAERRARAAAFRALLLARQRRFDGARSAFAEAARLDPELDLTAVPTFWQLERGAHEAAVDAYEETGRGREAVALEARLRQVYRPRLVSRPGATAAR